MAAPIIPIAMALAQFAPHLMRFFNAGEASTSVAQKVADVAMTVAGAGSPEEALSSIRANAELQIQFQQRTMELDAEMERDYLVDRQDARKRDIALAAAGQRNYRADIMVAVDAIGLVACLVSLVMFRDALPAEAVTLITTIAGIFGLCLRDAHQFEFGSSRGSKERGSAQDNLIRSMLGHK